MDFWSLKNWQLMIDEDMYPEENIRIVVRKKDEFYTGLATWYYVKPVNMEEGTSVYYWQKWDHLRRLRLVTSNDLFNFFNGLFITKR